MLQRTLQLFEAWRAAPWPCEGVHPWGLARPSKRPSLGNFQLPFHNAACSCDQLLHVTSGCAGNIAGTIDDVVRSVRASGTVRSFTTLPR